MALEVPLLGRVVGAHTATLRLAATSTGADYLNAPYDTGEVDETGFLAESVEIEVIGVVEDSGVGADSGADEGAPAVTEGGETPGGCGCASGGAPVGGVVLAGLGAVLGWWRRRDPDSARS